MVILCSRYINNNYNKVDCCLIMSELPVSMPDTPSPEQISDLIEPVSDAWAVFLKTERVLLAFVFLAQAILVLSNGWLYLIKGGMWRSYPLSMSYCLILLFCLLSIYYEFFMAVGCGDHDCLGHLLVNTGPEYTDHFSIRHQRDIYAISLIWKLR